MSREFFWGGDAGNSLKQSLSLHDGYVLSEVHQPERDAIMAETQAIRTHDTPPDDLSFGRWCLRIPELDLMLLKRKYPELDSKDGQIKTQAWKKFLSSSESKPYRVQDSAREKYFNGIDTSTTTRPDAVISTPG